MNAKFKELLAGLSTSTGGGKVTIDQAKFRAFLHNVNDLITEVEVDAGRAGFVAGAAKGHVEGYSYGVIDGEHPEDFDFSSEASQYAEKIRRGEA
jgi:hypothetical protein